MKFAAAIVLCLASSVHAGVYNIGNSLTADAMAWLLDDWSGYHVQCGASLPAIYANPAPCVTGFENWDVALASHEFDVVTVQPYGGTVAANVTAVSAWIAMQPATTKWVFHTSYPRIDGANVDPANYRAETQQIIQHAEDVIDQLRAIYPDRQIARDRSADALLMISANASGGIGPYGSVTDIYRDAVHLNNNSGGRDGGYLTHQLLRLAIGQPLSPASPTFNALAVDRRAYLNGVISQVTGISIEDPADFNHDGRVDRDDLLVWTSGYGLVDQTNNFLGDANGDGRVDGADFLEWQSGQSVAAVVIPATPAVPEPGAAPLALTMIIAEAIWLRGWR